MPEESEREILHRAVEEWGEDTQIALSIEECSELTTELGRLFRGRSVDEDVIEEIADVQIMMEQLSIIFGEGAVEEAIERKMNRLEGRLG